MRGRGFAHSNLTTHLCGLATLFILHLQIIMYILIRMCSFFLFLAVENRKLLNHSLLLRGLGAPLTTPSILLGFYASETCSLVSTSQNSSLSSLASSGLLSYTASGVRTCASLRFPPIKSLNSVKSLIAVSKPLCKPN